MNKTLIVVVQCNTISLVGPFHSIPHVLLFQQLCVPNVDRTKTGDIAVSQTTRKSPCSRFMTVGLSASRAPQTQILLRTCNVYSIGPAQYARLELFGDVDFTLRCSLASLGIPGTTSFFRSVYRFIYRGFFRFPLPASMLACYIDECMHSLAMVCIRETVCLLPWILVVPYTNNKKGQEKIVVLCNLIS